jgi:hypothetical protein
MPVDTGKVREWADAVSGWFDSGMAITTMTVAGSLAPLAREAADELDELRAALAASPHSAVCAYMTAHFTEPCSCHKAGSATPGRTT